jgi:hypothetical protein
MTKTERKKMIGADDLANRFQYHRPANSFVEDQHNRVRVMLLEVAEELDHRLPDGREKSLAITKLEETMFWANAAIARSKIHN